MAVSICKILPQFIFLLNNPFDEIALWSGRGAGKSRAVAQYIIGRTLTEKMKVLCVRQIKDRAKDSVFEEIKNAAIDYGLDEHFRFGAREIWVKSTGSKIIYCGLHDNIHSIKSLSNIKLCWVEEAHEIKQEALQLLYPTILRNEGAKIIYTYNPHTAEDAIYKRFHGDKKPPKSIVKKADWRDNPYFSDAMKLQREFDFEIDAEMAMHVWEGALCPSPNDIAVIPQAWVRKCVDAHIKLKLTIPAHYKHIGFDISDVGPDKSALALREGPVVLDALEFKEPEINDAVDRADIYAKAHSNVTKIIYDANGIGAGAKGDFNRIDERDYWAIPFIGSQAAFGKEYDFNGKSTNGEFFRNCKSQIWWHLRLRVQNTLRLIKGIEVDPCKCFFISGTIPELIREKLIMQLGQASYKKKDGKLMVDKQPDDQPSPDMADAVAMAFSYDIQSGIRADSKSGYWS